MLEAVMRKIGVKRSENIPKNMQIYAQNHIIEQENTEMQEGSPGPIDSHLLSYASIALEANHSILIHGQNPDLNKFYLRQLVKFIPLNEPTAIFEKEHYTINAEMLLIHAHQLYSSRYSSRNLAKCIEDSLNLHPDWIVVDEVLGKDANQLFSSMDFGTSFTATIKTSKGANYLINELILKPFSVDSARVSTLDVSIHTDSILNTTSVFEYEWLSRAEIEEGTDLSGMDMFQSKEIYIHSKESLTTSKIIKNYSSLTCFSIEDTIKELENRAKLL